METIKSYLESMFRSLPKTNQVLKLKNDLLLNMEEKYNELKSEGKSENEAIGIVISEFGNIDELVNELGIEKNNEEAMLPTITLEEAESFMAVKKKAGRLVGIGVSLCMLAVAMLILLETLIENNVIGKDLSGDARDLPGLLALFIIIVPAVALFIYSGMKLEKYKYLKEQFYLPINVKTIIEQRYNEFSSTFMVAIIIGVCLCILSPVALFVADALGNNILEDLGTVALLMIVMFPVFIFIYFGNIKESFSMLLKIDDFSKEKVESNKFIGAVAAIVWPLAVCIYMITGFIYNQWHINWIIFPITGILFGVFCSVYSSLKGHEK